ncbi:S-locus protein kinase [Artemisia annua]|uniref:S-locus protein kinase n=1 Tax=Artemisia annua TaxID=35608 RepID=A0A2U1NHB9_ARTAN|nr:S-locus protein kinase [Artemisia annua]
MAKIDEFLLRASSHSGSNNNKLIKVAVPTVASFLVISVILALYVWRKKNRSWMHRKGNALQTLDQDYTNESQKEPAELPSFSLSKIANSTNNFSINNKLGQGGFGPVFKIRTNQNYYPQQFSTNGL